MTDPIPSRLVERAVSELANLPGIGRRTALRLALHLLKQPEHVASGLGKALIDMSESVSYCPECHSLSDGGPCAFCTNPKRRADLVCVVEDLPDQLAIEKTRQFQGLYHVLGGVISPMDGLGPGDLTINSLLRRIKEQQITELVLALPSTIEGDTTAFYIFKQLKDSGILITSIARGVPIGDDLEYADELTLGRSILQRIPYDARI
jgi:recombination protein RecR